jgi:hypothetical protein
LSAEALSSKRSKVVVDNRVLACVRDQTITVVDVMKKLDMIFYQQYPQYRGIPEARYEFYAANWRKALDELVDRRLALLLAEEKQFRLTNGDIREELEEIYGPNVLMSLYGEGISIQDAHEMMREDILFRRVVSFFVQMPIYAEITPNIVKEAYDKKLETFKQQKGWLWRSVTIKSKTGSCSKQEADTIWRDLHSRATKLRDLVAKPPEGLEIVVSQQFKSLYHDVSEAVSSVLNSLPIGSFSQPVAAQKNESSGTWRLYIVDEHFAPKTPEFCEIENALKQEIATPQISIKSEEFFQDLRKRYHAKYVLSEDQLLSLQPFSLKHKDNGDDATVSAK